MQHFSRHVTRIIQDGSKPPLQPCPPHSPPLSLSQQPRALPSATVSDNCRQMPCSKVPNPAVITSLFHYFIISLFHYVIISLLAPRSHAQFSSSKRLPHPPTPPPSVSAYRALVCAFNWRRVLADPSLLNLIAPLFSRVFCPALDAQALPGAYSLCGVWVGCVCV